jgi:hypothetical protein
MILPEFCKADALETIQDARELLALAPEHICCAYIARISRLMAFLEAARAAAPLLPKRPAPSFTTSTHPPGEPTNER